MTTDGASNMMNVHKHKDEKNERKLKNETMTISEGLRCASHTIHNIIKPVMFLPIVMKVRRTITKIRDSSALQSELKTPDSALPTLQTDCVVRWNSTLKMLQSFLRWKEILVGYQIQTVSMVRFLDMDGGLTWQVDAYRCFKGA